MTILKEVYNENIRLYCAGSGCIAINWGLIGFEFDLVKLYLVI